MNTQLADTIISKEGTAYITIDGKNRPMFEVSAIKAQIDLTVIERNMLGHRMKQHKVAGSAGTGSATLYFMDSDMLKQTVAYIKSGQFSGFKLQLKNMDPQSSVGAQEVVLYNVIFPTIQVISIDDQSEDPVTFDSDFTYDDIDALSYFGKPSNFSL